MIAEDVLTIAHYFNVELHVVNHRLKLDYDPKRPPHFHVVDFIKNHKPLFAPDSPIEPLQDGGYPVLYDKALNGQQMRAVHMLARLYMRYGDSLLYSGRSVNDANVFFVDWRDDVIQSLGVDRYRLEELIAELYSTGVFELDRLCNFVRIGTGYQHQQHAYNAYRVISSDIAPVYPLYTGWANTA